MVLVCQIAGFSQILEWCIKYVEFCVVINMVHRYIDGFVDHGMKCFLFTLLFMYIQFFSAKGKYIVGCWCFVHLDLALYYVLFCTIICIIFTSLCRHRKASAKTQVSLTRFLQSEVKIIHIIVQNNTYCWVKLWSSFLSVLIPTSPISCMDVLMLFDSLFHNLFRFI